ncbi:MAG: hypothetical protein P4M11_14005 [Candidatus Pacebacteria bacterium]|nr:hypothetical protein [Candidatus Paceibacterota bacterium]
MVNTNVTVCVHGTLNSNTNTCVCDSGWYTPTGAGAVIANSTNVYNKCTAKTSSESTPFYETVPLASP